jgi:hypothetical protein
MVPNSFRSLTEKVGTGARTPVSCARASGGILVTTAIAMNSGTRAGTERDMVDLAVA